MKAKKLLLKVMITIIGTFLVIYSDSAPFVVEPLHAKAGVTFLPAAWGFKRKITIKNQGDKVSGAVIQVQFDKANFDYSKVRAGGADIRFSTMSGNLKDAELPYWIEKWNDSGASCIWVKLPVLKSHGLHTIYMYYGNADAQPVSNGNAVFLFFDDFEDIDYTKKWSNVSIGEVVEQDGVLKLKETDGQDGIITANLDVTGQMIIRTLYQRGGADQHWVRAGVGGWNNWFCFGDHTDFAGTGTNYVMLYDSASIYNLKTSPLIKAANKIITDKWRPASYWYDGKSLKGMQDGVMVEWPATNGSSKLALRTLDNDNWDNFAFVTVSRYINPAPVVIVKQQENNKPAL